MLVGEIYAERADQTSVNNVTLSPQTIIIGNVPDFYLCNNSFVITTSQVVEQQKIDVDSLVVSVGANGLWHNVTSMSKVAIAKEEWMKLTVLRAGVEEAFQAVNVSANLTLTLPPIHPLMVNTGPLNISEADAQSVNGTVLDHAVEVYRLLSTNITANETQAFLYIRASDIERNGSVPLFMFGDIVVSDFTNGQLERIVAERGQGTINQLIETELAAADNITAAQAERVFLPAPLTPGGNTSHCNNVSYGAGFLSGTLLPIQVPIGHLMPGRPAPPAAYLVLDAGFSYDQEWVIVRGVESLSLSVLLDVRNRMSSNATTLHSAGQGGTGSSPSSAQLLTARMVTHGLVPPFPDSRLPGQSALEEEEQLRFLAAAGSGLGSPNSDASLNIGMPRIGADFSASAKLTAGFNYWFHVGASVHGIFRKAHTHWYDPSSWEQIGLQLQGSVSTGLEAWVKAQADVSLAIDPHILWQRILAYVFFVGPLPLWLTPEIRAVWQGSADASAHASLTVTASASGWLNIGGGWLRDTGMYANAQAGVDGGVEPSGSHS